MSRAPSWPRKSTTPSKSPSAPKATPRAIRLVSSARAATLRSLALREAVEEWPQKEMLKFEKETLGFYITAHPLDKYDRELRRIGKLTTADLPAAPDGSQVRLAGVVQAVKLKNNKSGKRYATFSLEDRDGAVECIIWPEAYQKYEAVIMGDEPVAAKWQARR